MTQMQALALMLDDAAAQTPCLEMIPLLCSLRDLVNEHSDQGGLDAALSDRVTSLCRLANGREISKDIPGMVRRLLFELMIPEEAWGQEWDLPRRRCCRVAEQLRKLRRIRKWYIKLLCLWEDARFRQEESDAFDAQQRTVYEEFERMLLLWRTSIMAQNIERNMEWVHTLEAWDESLPKEDIRSSMKDALTRAALQSERMNQLIESTEKNRAHRG